MRYFPLQRFVMLHSSFSSSHFLLSLLLMSFLLHFRSRCSMVSGVLHSSQSPSGWCFILYSHSFSSTLPSRSLVIWTSRPRGLSWYFIFVESIGSVFL